MSASLLSLGVNSNQQEQIDSGINNVDTPESRNIQDTAKEVQ